MNGFRTLYQSGEIIAVISRDLRNFEPVRRIFLLNKMAITALDIFSTISLNISRNVTNEPAFYASNLIEGGCRLAEICRGFYLYQTDPNIDQWDCLGHIMVNIVNVYRIAMILLKPLEKQSKNLAVVACIDTLLRICLLLRTEVVSKVFNSLRNDHNLRLNSLFGLVIMSCGISIIHSSNLPVADVIGLSTMACMTVEIINNVVHKIFDHLGVQHRFRDAFEGSISGFSMWAIIHAAVVGLGLSKNPLGAALGIHYIALGAILIMDVVCKGVKGEHLRI